MGPWFCGIPGFGPVRSLDLMRLLGRGLPTGPAEGPGGALGHRGQVAVSHDARHDAVPGGTRLLRA